MDGSKQSRLDPFTQVPSKPLDLIGDKTILGNIMDQIRQNGVNQFYLSINHKSRRIKAYFDDSNIGYKYYVGEQNP